MPTITLNCTNCGFKVERRKRDVSITGKAFCSRSCAATHNNKIAPKRKPESICKGVGCGKPIPTSRSYCTTCWDRRVELRAAATLAPIKRINIFRRAFRAVQRKIKRRDKLKVSNRQLYKEQYPIFRARIVADLGNKCKWCDRTDNLKIHAKETGKKVCDLIGWYMSEERIKASLLQLELLCPDHRKEATNVKKRPIRHETVYCAVKLKCQCDPCIEFAINYKLEQNENKRWKRQGLDPNNLPAGL